MTTDNLTIDGALVANWCIVYTALCKNLLTVLYLHKFYDKFGVLPVGLQALGLAYTPCCRIAIMKYLSSVRGNCYIFALYFQANGPPFRGSAIPGVRFRVSG